MSIIEIILIAIGLSMDAFAVSITLGLSSSANVPKIKKYLLPGLYFGAFQAVMPLIGFFAAVRFANRVAGVDHWIAFALLAFIGGKMIFESLKKDDDENVVNKNSFRVVNMLLLAVATSIDALAVGVTFTFFQINIFLAVMIIGITTFVLSIVGVKIGRVFGAKFKSKAEFAGGAVLVGLGVKILVEDLFF